MSGVDSLSCVAIGLLAAIMAYVIYGIVYGYNWSAEDKKVTQKALS